MTRPQVTILLALATISLAVVAIGQPMTSGGFTELHRVEVAGASELELVMGLIERSGESTSAKHYHPGGEFAFVLEGAVTVTAENEPPVTIKAGTSFYQPPGEWHAISTAARGAKTVVFRVVQKGQPMIVAAD
jgi:quercetin dioxygenase-like cupin family protein